MESVALLHLLIFSLHMFHVSESDLWVGSWQRLIWLFGWICSKQHDKSLVA